MISEYMEHQVWEPEASPSAYRSTPMPGVTACRFVFPAAGVPHQASLLFPEHFEAVFCLFGELSLRAGGKTILVRSGGLLLTGEAIVEICRIKAAGTVLLTAEVDKQAVAASLKGDFSSLFDVQVMRSRIDIGKGSCLLLDMGWSNSVLSALRTLPPERHGDYFVLRLMERLCLLRYQPAAGWAVKNSRDQEQQEIVQQIGFYIKEHLNQALTISKIARQFGMSPTSLKAVFRRINGIPLHAWLQQCRMEEAARLLITTRENVQVIAAKVGYTGTSRFYAVFREWYHMTPSEYRRISDKNV